LDLISSSNDDWLASLLEPSILPIRFSLIEFNHVTTLLLNFTCCYFVPGMSIAVFVWIAGFLLMGLGGVTIFWIGALLIRLRQSRQASVKHTKKPSFETLQVIHLSDTSSRHPLSLPVVSSAKQASTLDMSVDALAEREDLLAFDSFSNQIKSNSHEKGIDEKTSKHGKLSKDKRITKDMIESSSIHGNQPQSSTEIFPCLDSNQSESSLRFDSDFGHPLKRPKFDRQEV
jgi:hypothetical protein